MEHETQKSVYDWCVAMFPRHIGSKGRVIALIEEVVELALSVGIYPSAIEAAVKVPMLKDVIRVGNGERNYRTEENREEAADALLCIYAYAQEEGFDVHEELDRKMVLNRSRPKEYYAAKTAQKEDLGFILPDAPER